MSSSIREDYRQHSRSSSDTHIPDLEKGDARPDKEEEEAVEEKVCDFNFTLREIRQNAFATQPGDLDVSVRSIAHDAEGYSG
jgi:hypothetical protein